MKNARRVLVTLVCAAVCTASLANRSRLDDEDAAKRGDCEIELAAARQTSRGAAAEREATVELDCGIGFGTELVAAAGRQRSAGERSESIDLEARTALLRTGEGSSGIAWALAYGASAERGAGAPWRRSAHFGALEANWRPANNWVVDGRVGWRRDHLERREMRLWTLAVEHEISDRLEARVEVEDDTRSRPLASIELRFEFWPDRARLNVSYAARGRPTHERRLGVGVTFEF